ncbi:MAG: TrmH family RNA methyltransferase [Nitrospirales bacterium]|nr:TrmH family RNA methyltransferase [Nitrospirales bacterium]
MEKSTAALPFIASQHNPSFKQWRALLTTSGIKQHAQFLLHGKKVVEETLVKHTQHCRAVITSERFLALPHVPASVKMFSLSHSLFQKLDCFGTQNPLLVCRVPPLPMIDLREPPDGVEVLCPLGDPTNVGALLRSCQAFGATKLIFLEEATHPCHPKSVRAASGAIFNQPLYQGPALQRLHQEHLDHSTIALTMQGTPLTKFTWPINIRLVIGEEGPGLPSDLDLPCISIPMHNQNHSLNASIAASIALYAYRLAHPWGVR